MIDYHKLLKKLESIIESEVTINKDSKIDNNILDRKKTTIIVQMVCGCPVGTHPPGPCGITGFGQEYESNPYNPKFYF